MVLDQSTSSLTSLPEFPLSSENKPEMKRKQDDSHPRPNFYGYFRESALREIMPLTIVVKIVANYRISYLITTRHGNSLRHKVD